VSDRPALDLREHELAFFGQVTASLSHQINNVLTIVNELGGLLGDMTASGNVGEAQGERLGRLAERILGNVERGTEYLRLLNRFAHTVDQPSADVGAAEQVRLVAALAQRFAELRQARLAVEAPAAGPVLRTSPFRLLHALFACVQGALDADGVGVITVTVETAAGVVRFRIQADREVDRTGPAHADRLRLLEELCDGLGAGFRFEAGRGASVYEIAFDERTTGGDNGECT